MGGWRLDQQLVTLKKALIQSTSILQACASTHLEHLSTTHMEYSQGQEPAHWAAGSEGSCSLYLQLGQAGVAQGLTLVMRDQQNLCTTKQSK